MIFPFFLSQNKKVRKETRVYVTSSYVWNQSDQIGRIFAQSATVYLSHVFFKKITEVAHILCYFSPMYV
jgi:hypothetical protein